MYVLKSFVKAYGNTKNFRMFNFPDVLTRAFSDPPATLKESQPISFSSSASAGIVYIGMISKNQYAYGTLGQSQNYNDIKKPDRSQMFLKEIHS